MSNLEDTLKGILRYAHQTGRSDEYLGIKDVHFERGIDRRVRGIIQAFKDDGWVHIPQAELVERWERDKPSEFRINGEVVKTGPEWYAAFEKELPKDVEIKYDSHQNVSFNAGNNHGLRVAREAARRASGMEASNE